MFAKLSELLEPVHSGVIQVQTPNRLRNFANVKCFLTGRYIGVRSFFVGYLRFPLFLVIGRRRLQARLFFCRV